jgi:hypothetical protein
VHFVGSYYIWTYLLTKNIKIQTIAVVTGQLKILPTAIKGGKF